MSGSYIVSARKYRPSSFTSVVGQEALTRTLRNAISSGRLAQAYLFCGPRGVGKTSCARIFAKTINCEHRTPDGEACGECDSCRDFDRGVSYNVIELDAASNNGVDHMRTLTEQVNVPPAAGRYRVFIIDEVHMLSSGAFNAFLKTLEEPPAYVIFILATTEKNKVLPTILSRCQTYDFARITERDISKQLRRVADAEGISAEEEALEVIARKADGAMRDALSIFDQVTAASGGNVTYRSAIENLNVLDYEVYFRFTSAFAKADVPEALLLYAQVRDAGFDARFFVSGLAMHVRNLLVAQSEATAKLLEVGQKGAERYLAQAGQFDAAWYYRALDLLSECDLNFREATDKQLLTELTLIRLCQLRAPQGQPPESKAPLKPIAGTREAHPSAAPAKPTPAAAKTDTPVNAAPTIANPAPAVKMQRIVPPPPVRKVRSGVRPAAPSLRLRETATKSVDAPESKTEDDPAPQDNGTPAEADALRRAWEGFIAANADKKLLLTAMRRGLPEHLEGALYQFNVDNQAQLQEAEAHILALTQYLRAQTGNAALSLSVRENEAAERPHHLSPAETLAEMVKNYPATAHLLDMLDAEQI